jgi:hypothetical protein
MGIFRRVGSGSGQVNLSGASSSEGLAHALAEVMVRHSIVVYGHSGGHPAPDSRRAVEARPRARFGDNRETATPLQKALRQRMAAKQHDRPGASA